MFANRCFRKILKIVIAGLLTLFYFIGFEPNDLLIRNKEDPTKNFKQYMPKCDCQKNDLIFVNKQNSIDKPGWYEVTSTFTDKNYIVKETELDELVCGIYETLRRGRHQKVIGYSIYGANTRYTLALKSICSHLVTSI